MNVHSRHVCLDCSTTIPARSYRATCPKCHGQLEPADVESSPDRTLPSFLRYGTPDD